MPCIRITLVAAAAAVFVRGVAGGELDFIREVRRDFNTGLFARQELDGLTLGAQVNGIPVNLNVFTKSLGAAPPAITFSGDPERPFAIEGASDTVTTFQTAVDKACDEVQFNECAKVANEQKQFEVDDCDQQKQQCHDELDSAKQQSFLDETPSDSDDEFDYFCELGS